MKTPKWKPKNNYKKLSKKERAKAIEEAACLVWDSLHSHLKHTYTKHDRDFDKRCVQEYARVMYLLSRLY